MPLCCPQAEAIQHAGKNLRCPPRDCLAADEKAEPSKLLATRQPRQPPPADQDIIVLRCAVLAWHQTLCSTHLYSLMEASKASPVACTSVTTVLRPCIVWYSPAAWAP